MDRSILAALSRGRQTALLIALAAVLLALFASVAYAASFEGTSGPDVPSKERPRPTGPS